MAKINVKLDAKAKQTVAKTADIGGGVEPTGKIDITENGEYNVKDYAKANVSVAGEVDPYLTSARKIYDAINGKSLNFDKLVNFLDKYDLYPNFSSSEDRYEVHFVRFSADYTWYDNATIFGVVGNSDGSAFLMLGSTINEDDFKKSYMESYYSNIDASMLFGSDISTEEVLPKFYLFGGSIDKKILPQDFFGIWE